MNNTIKFIGAGIIGGIFSFGLAHVFEEPSTKITSTQQSFNQPSTTFTAAPVSFNNLASSEVKDFTFAAEKTVNSVVHIKTEYNQTYSNDPYLDFFWGPRGSRGSRPMVATGSGVVISKDGYIVTNNHVIEDADKVEVSMNDERTFTAKVIGTDPSTDLALIKIEADEDLSFTTFANSDNVKIGEWVLAVGNPFNLTSTVTAGIVSAKARNINLLRGNSREEVFPLESFIQTDAAVNPGNSGGALVNPNGELVVINTAIASKTGSYTGYSFAVPSNIAKKVTEDLLTYGIVQRAFIGVSIENVNQKLVDELNLKDLKGVMVNGIAEDGAAQIAGIQENDIILKVGNVEVNNVPQLQEQIGKFRPGDKVNLTVRRNEDESVYTLELRNKEGKTNVIKKEEENKFASLGASFKRLTAGELKDLKIKYGVKVSSIKPGKLRSAGITEGFIITHLDQKPVKKPEEVVYFFNNQKGGVLVEGIYPNGMKGYFGFGI
jgi:Do/DeqQ family serine protease